MPAQILGTAVGGFVLLTNAQTLGKAIGLDDDQLVAAYVAICLIWAASLSVSVASVRSAQRRDQLNAAGMAPS